MKASHRHCHKFTIVCLKGSQQLLHSTTAVQLSSALLQLCRMNHSKKTFTIFHSTVAHAEDFVHLYSVFICSVKHNNNKEKQVFNVFRVCSDLARVGVCSSFLLMYAGSDVTLH